MAGTLPGAHTGRSGRILLLATRMRGAQILIAGARQEPFRAVVGAPTVGALLHLHGGEKLQNTVLHNIGGGRR